MGQSGSVPEEDKKFFDLEERKAYKASWTTEQKKNATSFAKTIAPAKNIRNLLQDLVAGKVADMELFKKEVKCDLTCFTKYKLGSDQFINVDDSNSLDMQIQIVEPLPGSISMVYLIWNSGETHLIWIIREHDGKYFRVEPHGERPDLNSPQIQKAMRDSALVFRNDVQPLGLSMCRLAATYSLISYICKWNFDEKQMLAPMTEETCTSFNHYLTAYDRSEAGDSARKSERPRKRQQAPEPDRKARAAPAKRVALFTK